MKPTLRCRCGEDRAVEAFAYDKAPEGESRFDLGGQAYCRRYDRCTVCQHHFSRHDMDLSALYGGAYVDATYGSADAMKRTFERIMGLPPDRSDNRARVAWVNAKVQDVCPHIFARGRRSLLDVGAGLGVFPCAMQETGWSVLALDPDPRSKQHLESVAGVPAVSMDFLTGAVSELGRFDLISFNKVLEHIEDPAVMLERAMDLLNDDGALYLELPDVAAATDPAGGHREEFFIEHHHVFSPASLVMLGENNGLSLRALERVREPSSKYTLRSLFVRAS